MAGFRCAGADEVLVSSIMSQIGYIPAYAGMRRYDAGLANYLLLRTEHFKMQEAWAFYCGLQSWRDGESVIMSDASRHLPRTTNQAVFAADRPDDPLMPPCQAAAADGRNGRRRCRIAAWRKRTITSVVCCDTGQTAYRHLLGNTAARVDLWL